MFDELINKAKSMRGELLGQTQIAICTRESQNLKAFLNVIPHAEGVAGPNQYRTLYGGELFTDFSRHPRKVVTKWGKSSSSAGAYQIGMVTWTELQALLNLPDFSPKSQDIGAVALIRRRHALKLIQEGRIVEALTRTKISSEWTSLPSGIHARTNIDQILNVFQNSGGILA